MASYNDSEVAEIAKAYAKVISVYHRTMIDNSAASRERLKADAKELVGKITPEVERSLDLEGVLTILKVNSLSEI